MKRTRVLPTSHFPARPPVLATAVAYMAIDLYQAPGWVWGMFVTLAVLIWIGWFAAWWHQDAAPLTGYGEPK